jgi:hypothetical protein
MVIGSGTGVGVLITSSTLISVRSLILEGREELMPDRARK